MLEKSLKIASSKDLLSINVAKQLISENKGFEYARISKNGSLDSIKQELYAKEYDMACLPLSNIPFVLPDGIVLAGVSERFDSSLKFVGSPNCIDGETLRDLKPGVKVLVPNQIIKDQLLKLLPEVQCEVNDLNFKDIATQLKENKIDGFICPVFEIDQSDFNLSDYYEWTFSPYEMVGIPAAGVVTFICRMDDIIVRKFIKGIHQNDISRCTNIERKIMKSFDLDTLGAYCSKDERNNFHIHASHTSEENDRCFFTQSTSAGLAEKIIEIFSNETNLSTI